MFDRVKFGFLRFSRLFQGLFGRAESVVENFGIRRIGCSFAIYEGECCTLSPFGITNIGFWHQIWSFFDKGGPIYAKLASTRAYVNLIDERCFTRISNAKLYVKTWKKER